MYFGNYILRRTWLHKSPVSEESSTSDLVNSLKHGSDFKVSTFTIFINHSDGN